MSIKDLKAMYLDQLHDLYSANKQSATVTAQLAKAASNEELSSALTRGEKGIKDGMATIKAIVAAHGDSNESEHCMGMEGLVKEAEAHALKESFGSDETRDAMIIAQYQRMAHYAIAGYGCLAAFAKRLELQDDHKKIKQCLDACYDGDRTMTELAESGINAEAV